MTRPVPLLLVLDLAGVFAFALTALEPARLDLVGVLTLAGITALGGGIIMDSAPARVRAEERLRCPHRRAVDLGTSRAASGRF